MMMKVASDYITPPGWRGGAVSSDVLRCGMDGDQVGIRAVGYRDNP